VPTDNIAAALEAVNKALQDGGAGPAAFTDLSEAVEQATSFCDCYTDGAGWHLGHTHDKWFGSSERLLKVLAPHATDGSFVRLIGEDDSLFGYRVVDGVLRDESGDFTWTLREQS
jgi:hypothetical protein